MKQPQAILFDMDGTLLDSEKLWRIAENAFFERYDIQLSHEEHQAFIGKEISVIMAALKERFGLKPSRDALVQEMRAHVKTLLQNVEDMPGAGEMLTFVESKGLKRALVSNSSRDIIVTSLQHKPWASLLEHRFSADDVENAKPAPDIYLLAAQHLGVAPENCLVLEDSLTGVQAARSAQMTCFALPSEARPNLPAFQALTPYIFKDLGEVQQKLASMFILA